VRIPHTAGYPQESFLVEARSVSSYSGSPAFVWTPPFSHRGSLLGTALSQRSAIALLGVGWGHIQEPTAVVMDDAPTQETGMSVQGNVGLVGVVPAWKILDLLSAM
jgi:hypothetical protein